MERPPVVQKVEDNTQVHHMAGNMDRKVDNMDHKEGKDLDMDRKLAGNNSVISRKQDNIGILLDSSHCFHFYLHAALSGIN